MQTFISILRGINVSGQKKMLMSELKALYEGLKFKEVITYIQSGNVLFKSEKNLSDLELAAKIEKAIYKKYGFEVPVIIRTKNEIQNIITVNPFLKEKNIEVKRLYVTFLSETPAKENIESAKNFDSSPDQFFIIGKEAYLCVSNGYGETKLSNNFFEKKLKVNATTRNWNTVQKLLELAE